MFHRGADRRTNGTMRAASLYRGKLPLVLRARDGLAGRAQFGGWSPAGRRGGSPTLVGPLRPDRAGGGVVGDDRWQGARNAGAAFASRRPLGRARPPVIHSAKLPGRRCGKHGLGGRTGEKQLDGPVSVTCTKQAQCRPTTAYRGEVHQAEHGAAAACAINCATARGRSRETPTVRAGRA